MSSRSITSNPVLDFFLPKFDRTSVYLMALAFVFLFLTGGDLRSDVFESLAFVGQFIGIFVVAVVVSLFVGLLAALVCPFKSHRLGKHSKEYLFCFAVGITGLSGLAGVIYMLSNSTSLIIFFVFWNLAHCVVLVLMLLLGVLDPTDIVEKRVRFSELLVCTCVLMVTLCLCRYLWHPYWTVTFSIGIGVATGVASLHRRVFASDTPMAKLKPAKERSSHYLTYLSEPSDAWDD